MPAVKTPKISGVWDKFEATRAELSTALIERHEEIDLALCALICQQHLLLVGPPGTAKSLVAESVRQWIDGARSLTIHCCKDTTRNVAFGPLKLSALKDDRTERALKGGAADVDVLILEEVFKAGPAVLDMFLMLMNERVYREGLVSSQTPLKFLLGVSNEWSPDGCEAALSAFFDRFLFRKAVRPVSRNGIESLVGLPIDGEPPPHDTTPQLSTTVTIKELETAKNRSEKIQFTEEAGDAFFKLYDELTKDGIQPGDRRLKQSVKAAQAYAYLEGADEVRPEHLQILEHILWTEPMEQPARCAKIVSKLANPILSQINDLRTQAESVFAKSTPTDAVPKLQEIQKEILKLSSHPKKEAAKNHVGELIKKSYNKVIGAKEEA